jgi:hypothetical protein
MTYEISFNDRHIIRTPEFSNWECHMFGGHKCGSGIVWRPHKGGEPNWFWRKMQWLFFGNVWVKYK